MQPLKAIAAAAAAARQWIRIHLARHIAPPCSGGSSTFRLNQAAQASPSAGSSRTQEVGAKEEASTSEKPHSLNVQAIVARAASEEDDDDEEQERIREEEEEKDQVRLTRLLKTRRNDGAPLAQALQGFRPSQELVGSVLQVIESAETAIEFFEWADAHPGFKNGTYTTNCLLFALVRLGRSRKAYDLFLQMNNQQQQWRRIGDAFTSSVLVYGLSQCGELDAAIEMVKQTSGSPYPRVVNSLLQTLCDAGRFDDALATARRCSRPDDAPVAYSILIAAAARLRRPGAARFLFAELRSRGGSPDAAAYGALMTALCRAGELRAAAALLSDMESRGVEPNVVVYTTLADGLCKCGKLEEAARLVSAMAARGVAPNVVTYTALVDAMCKAGKLDDAWAMVKSMAARGVAPNVVTLTAMVDGLAKARRVDEAAAWVEEMAGGGGIGVEPDAVMYTALVHGYCLARRMDEAAGVVEAMAARGIPPVHATFSAMIIGCLRSRELPRAYEFLRRMLERGTVCNLASYLALIYGFCEARCGGGDGCCAGGEEMAALFRLLGAMARGGLTVEEEMFESTVKLGRAEQILEAMHERGCVPNEEVFAALQATLASIRAVKDPRLGEDEVFGA